MRRRPRPLFRDRHRRPPPYAAAVEALAGQVRPGTVRHVTVSHDDWCGIFNGRSCDCDPQVTLIPTPEEN